MASVSEYTVHHGRVRRWLVTLNSSQEAETMDAGAQLAFSFSFRDPSIGNGAAHTNTELLCLSQPWQMCPEVGLSGPVTLTININHHNFFLFYPLFELCFIYCCIILKAVDIEACRKHAFMFHVYVLWREIKGRSPHPHRFYMCSQLWSACLHSKHFAYEAIFISLVSQGTVMETYNPQLCVYMCEYFLVCNLIPCMLSNTVRILMIKGKTPLTVNHEYSWNLCLSKRGSWVM